MQLGEVELISGEDLIELGMRADSERQRLHPGGIVTYCLDHSAALRCVIDSLGELTVVDASAIAPICAPGTTAVDYLRLLALLRLRTAIPHIQVDVEWTGLKLAQVALRFGADDLVNSKPGSRVSEEEIRRIIRDAGFVPKKRDPEYQSLAIY